MTTNVPYTFLEGIKTFVLWIGGALAGITALLYTCGYLVTRSHLAMLGLYGLVEYGNDYFLQEGAKFVITTAYAVLRPLLSIVVVLGVAVLVVGVLWSLVERSPLGAWMRRAGERVGAIARSGVVRRFGFALFLVALLAHAWHFFDDYERPLTVVNLLYEDPASGSAGDLSALVLAGDTVTLHHRFEGLLWGALLAALLTFAAWRVASPWPSRGWLVLPFAVTLTLYLVTLPMAYGVLERPVRYSVVRFAGEADAVPAGELLFLLDRKGDGFVVWDSASRRVLWVPASNVRRAEVRAVEPLFRPVKGAPK